LQEEFFLRVQALVTSLSSIPFLQHDPPTHKCLFHSLVLGCVREYFRVAHILVPFSFALMSFDTTLVFITLHLELDGYFSLFFEEYKLNQDLELSSNFFKLAL